VRDLRCSAWKLSRDAKDDVKETPLPDHIALRQPPDLPFPDQMHRLEPPTGTTDSPRPLLDKSMVLLNDVV
jgi:hypothetical protein